MVLKWIDDLWSGKSEFLMGSRKRYRIQMEVTGEHRNDDSGSVDVDPDPGDQGRDQRDPAMAEKGERVEQAKRMVKDKAWKHFGRPVIAELVVLWVATVVLATLALVGAASLLCMYMT